MRRNDYPLGYREDEEMYVYDQCCDNCCRYPCPMEENEYDSISERKHKEKLRRENAIVREGEPTWCIYWKGRGGRR